jgi:hypothetical protein
MEGESVFDFCCSIFVCGLSKEDIAIDLVEPNASEKTIENVRSHNESHAGSNRLILDKYNFHRSPGHHVDGGSLTEILVCLRATR